MFVLLVVSVLIFYLTAVVSSGLFGISLAFNIYHLRRRLIVKRINRTGSVILVELVTFQGDSNHFGFLFGRAPLSCNLTSIAK